MLGDLASRHCGRTLGKSWPKQSELKALVPGRQNEKLERDASRSTFEEASKSRLSTTSGSGPRGTSGIPRGSAQRGLVQSGRIPAPQGPSTLI